jgi:hypothetical protein
MSERLTKCDLEEMQAYVDGLRVIRPDLRSAAEQTCVVLYDEVKAQRRDNAELDRARHDWRMKYEVTVDAWEQSKLHREDDARRFDRLIEALGVPNGARVVGQTASGTTR